MPLCPVLSTFVKFSIIVGSSQEGRTDKVTLVKYVTSDVECGKFVANMSKMATSISHYFHDENDIFWGN